MVAELILGNLYNVNTFNINTLSKLSAHPTKLIKSYVRSGVSKSTFFSIYNF